MNIPFLKNKQGAAQSIMTTKVRTPDAPETQEDESNQGLLAAARDLITACQAGDEKGVAQALQSAFDICESQPHEEGDHFNEPEETI